MAHEWKAGDRAMVEIDEGVSYQHGCVIIKRRDDLQWAVPTSALHPLPPGVTPEAQAVLDAVSVAREARPPWEYNKFCDACEKLWEADDAYRASIAPPDPVKELREGWALAREYVDVKDIELRRRLDRAIAALEAK